MTQIYLLDPDTCAFILRKSSPMLLDRIQSVPLQQQFMSNNVKDFCRVKGRGMTQRWIDAGRPR